MEKKIEAKILELIPQAKWIHYNITGGYGTHEMGNIKFTTDELNGKEFSVGIVIYARDPFLSSFTCSKDEILENLNKFK